MAAIKDPSTFKQLLPNCLKDAGSVRDCQDIPSTSFISTRVNALWNAMNDLKDCFQSIEMTNLIKNIGCSGSTPITYPTSVKMSWKPEVNTNTLNVCSGISGLNLDKLKSIAASARTCSKPIYNNISNAILSVTGSGDCECRANFGIYFGAGVSAAAQYSAGLATGFIVGCDGCKFRFKGWWAWQAGLTSNLAVDAALLVGYAQTWDVFWGYANAVEVSIGPNVIAANVGVGLTLPEVIIDYEDKKVDKTVCVSGQCASSSKTVNAPKDVSFAGPEFATIEFAVSAGIGILPVDATLGFEGCYQLDL